MCTHVTRANRPCQSPVSRYGRDLATDQDWQYRLSDRIGWLSIPADDQSLANIHQGATCAETSLIDWEVQISMTVGGALLEEGILLAGLDFIDERLTEKACFA